MGYVSSEIGFPGLGIKGFGINRTAFTLFGRDVAWYGIIIALGMVHSKHHHLSSRFLARGL